MLPKTAPGARGGERERRRRRRVALLRSLACIDEKGTLGFGSQVPRRAQPKVPQLNSEMSSSRPVRLDRPLLHKSAASSHAIGGTESQTVLSVMAKFLAGPVHGSVVRGSNHGMDVFLFTIATYSPSSPPARSLASWSTDGRRSGYASRWSENGCCPYLILLPPHPLPVARCH